jgi:hypothetical protein
MQNTCTHAKFLLAYQRLSPDVVCCRFQKTSLKVAQELCNNGQIGAILNHFLCKFYAIAQAITKNNRLQKRCKGKHSQAACARSKNPYISRSELTNELPVARVNAANATLAINSVAHPSPLSSDAAVQFSGTIPPTIQPNPRTRLGTIL